jgi:hypothetical protein
VKTLSTFSRQRAGEYYATLCVLDALWP